MSALVFNDRGPPTFVEGLKLTLGVSALFAKGLVLDPLANSIKSAMISTFMEPDIEGEMNITRYGVPDPEAIMEFNRKQVGIRRWNPATDAPDDYSVSQGSQPMPI